MCDEVDGEPEVPESPRAADAMEVGLGGLGEVEVYDNIHCLYVDASCEEVWGGGGREEIFIHMYV